jgi:hypothetical protein
MNHLRRLSIPLLGALLALTLIPASAQNSDTNGIEDVSKLEGIQGSVDRSWESVPSTQATPVVSATPEGSATPVVSTMSTSLIATVMVFDTDSHAQATFELQRDAFLVGLDGSGSMVEGMDTEMSNQAIENLGNEAHAFDTHFTGEGIDAYSRYLLVWDGETVFFNIIVGPSLEAISAADLVMEYMVDEGGPSPEPETFAADGTSTGGIWGFFPANDHSSLNGLVPTTDQVQFPAQ